MNSTLQKLLEQLKDQTLPENRLQVLEPVAHYLAERLRSGFPVRLNFICTHNSRRSHLAQIWAQTAAQWAGLTSVVCYSGGTEATAVYSQVMATIEHQGFEIFQLSEGKNPVLAIRVDSVGVPIIAFSKAYDHPFNPRADFIAIMTCDSADEACPIVHGAEARFSVRYEDPKVYDSTNQKEEKYLERSLQIAQEWLWVMWEVKSRIKNLSTGIVS